MSESRFAEFAALHQAGAPLLLPNAWDFASAVIIADAGFAAIGTTSLGVAAAAGLPDAAGAAKAETIALARTIVRLPCPVTVDIEGGFSTDPGEVAELVAELAGFGVAGINLEDGLAEGGLADPVRQELLIGAIRNAVPELFVNARTDTYWLGAGADLLPDTLERVRRYAGAGAHGVFVPGLVAAAEVAQVLAASPVPVNLLFLPGRCTVAGLAELGVHRISTGSLPFRVALGAALDAVLAVRDGRPVVREGVALPTYDQIQRLIAGTA